MSSREWRPRLQQYCRDQVTDVRVVPVRDVSEAFDLGIEIVLVDDETSWLSPPFLDRSKTAGLPVIGLFRPQEADGHGRSFLERMGVGCALPSDVEPEDLVEVIRRQRLDSPPDIDLGSVAAKPPSGHGVAVGGPAGVGSTEISIGMAQLLAGSGRTVLVDLDDTYPSVGRRLDLAVQPNLLDTVDAILGVDCAVDGTPLRLEETLARPNRVRPPRLAFDVVAGLGRRQDWDVLEPGDVFDVVAALRQRWPLTVARIGSSVEPTGASGRHALGRGGLMLADRIVGVCDASPGGLLRFADWFVDAEESVNGRPVDVVFNRAPGRSSSRQELRTQLASMLGCQLGQVSFVAHDAKVARCAWNATMIDSRRFLGALAPLASACVR